MRQKVQTDYNYFLGGPFQYFNFYIVYCLLLDTINTDSSVPAK